MRVLHALVVVMLVAIVSDAARVRPRRGKFKNTTTMHTNRQGKVHVSSNPYPVDTHPQCQLDMSRAALTKPGSTYLPRTLSGKPDHLLTYREYTSLYTPFLPPINATIIPFSPLLPITYPTEQPCRAAQDKCAACLKLTHREAPFGCYCPVKVKVRLEVAPGWTPGPRDHPLDRYGYPAAAWQGPNIFAPPIQLWPTAPLPSPSDNIPFVLLVFSQGSGSSDAFTFAQGDSAAAFGDTHVASFDVEFHPDDIYASLGSQAEETAMYNRVEVMRLIINTFIEASNSGEGEFAEWKGLLKGNQTPVITSGWSLGGLTVLLNRLGSALANLLSWAQCKLAGLCLGNLVLDFPLDPTSEAVPNELLKEYNAPFASLAGESLGPVQALPVFFANDVSQFVNYVLMKDGDTHDDSSAESGLTLLTVQKELGINPEFVGFDADYLYENATEVMGPSLQVGLWFANAIRACHIFGLQEYCPYLLTCNAERIEGVRFFHMPIGNVCDTFDNARAILEEWPYGSQSSSSSASGVINSLEAHSEYIARDYLCIADPPVSLSSVSPRVALNLTRQELQGHFPARVCTTHCASE